MNEVDPQFGRRFDADENAQTLPPDDEEVEIRSVWISEIYGPSEFDDLVRALTDLGWESTPRFGAGSPPGEWLRAARQGTRPGATYPINLIGPKPSYGACMFQADLPDDIQSVNGAFCQIVPSITVLSLQFVVRPSGRSKLADILRRAYATRHDQIVGGGFEIIGPYFQKLRLARSRRLDLRAQCTDWIRTRLPGWFSKYAPDRFPCCEFLTTEVGEVFPTEAKSSQYLRLLGLHTSWFGYRSEHWPGLTLCTEHQDDSRWTWVLCGRTGEIFTDSELAGWGKRDNRGFANRLRYLADTLARQALYAHLVERALRLGTLRDELGKLSIDDHAGAVDRLAAVQKDVILHSRDVAVVVADARLLTSHNHLFFHEVGEFEPLDRRVGEPGLMESVRKNLVELSGRLETLFAALQPMVEMSAAFMNTRAADRLARSNNRMSVWMTWMAVAMLLATIVQIALALTRWAE